MSKLNNILIKLGFKPHKSNWLHFAVGVLCGIFAFVFSYFELELSIIQCIGLAGGFAALAGLIKELWDRPNFDWLDLIMTILGGFAGGLIVIPFTFI